MKRFDMFGSPLPGFNLKGSTKVSTNLGAALTFVTSVIVCIYAFSKLTLLSSVLGSNISTYHEESVTTAEDPMSLNERNFRIAFAFSGYRDKQIKHDPSYVRYIFRLTGYKNG